MNKKIKAIEIEAFRAYEKKQYFDFIHESTGEIADLVVIYAPNGHGKTSFFDAIEWSITGKIGRISSNRAISEEAKVGQGSILKNRDSDASQGIVKIIGEESEFFESKTIKLDNRMNNDYKPSKQNHVTPGFEGLLDEKKTFCSTNMLAHDKITEFLQTYTAADKSKALELFWDEKNESKIIEKILDLEKELEKQKKRLKDDMNKKEESLKKHIFEANKEKEIIKLMKEYNRSNKKSGLLYRDINDMNFLIESWSHISEIACIEKDNINEMLNKIDAILLELPQFCSTQKKIKDNAIQKNKLKDKIKNINSFKQKEEQKRILSLEIKSLSKIINNFDKYTKIALLLEQEIAKKDSLEKKKPIYLKQVIA